MDKKTKLILFAVICFVVINFASSRMHEQVHVAIYENYGLTNISVGYHWWGMDTTAYGICNDSCSLANSINESISYNLQAVMGFLLIMLGIIIILKDEENSQK